MIKRMQRLLKPSFRLSGRLETTRRAFSVSSDLLRVERHEEEGLASVLMKKSPVNSLNLELIEHLRDAIQNLEDDESISGILLSSDVPNIFSAGLDIQEMYRPDPDRIRAFWTALQDLWATLYGSSLATVASIEGHAPAGGCLLAMSCDYRVMTANPKLKIGLNEVALGIVAPFWFAETMSGTIGQRQTELALQLGTMFDPKEAERVGMVDSLECDAETTRQAAIDALRSFVKCPAHARHASKLRMRKALIDRLRSQQKEDADAFIEFANQDFVQRGLGKYMEALSKKGK